MSKQAGANETSNESYVNPDHTFVFEDDLDDNYVEPTATTDEVATAVQDLIGAAEGTVEGGNPEDLAVGEQSTTDTTTVIEGAATTDETVVSNDEPETLTAEEQLAAMRATLNAQAAELLQLRSGTPRQPVAVTQPVVAAQPAQPAAQPTTSTTPQTVDDFIATLGVDAENLDAIVTTPEGFNGFIKNMLQSYEGYMTPKLVEQVFLSLPAMVTHQIEVQTNINKTIEKFYTDHPVLAEHQNIVAGNIHVVRGESPDKSMQDCLVEAAKRSYRQLGLLQKQGIVTTSKAATTPSTEGQKPVQKVALPGRTSARFSGPAGRVTVDPALRQELDEL